MFDELVKPELEAICKKLAHPFYHLDGPGQLAHLDSLCAIEELKGIQWVPGAGVKPWQQWPEVYRKIRDAGKLVQVWGPMKDFETLVEAIGSAEGLIAFMEIQPGEEQEAEEFLNKYGVISGALQSA
jgi:hypothetical protein